MSHHTETSAGKCVFCGGPISDAKRIGHWKEFGGGGGFWFTGNCSGCNLEFRLSLRNGAFDEWRPDAPEASELKSSVGEDELPDLTAKISRYPMLGLKWSAFLARRRAGDVVWRFGSEDGNHKGFTIVRNGHPVARFIVFIEM